MSKVGQQTMPMSEGRGHALWLSVAFQGGHKAGWLTRERILHLGMVPHQEVPCPAPVWEAGMVALSLFGEQQALTHL